MRFIILLFTLTLTQSFLFGQTKGNYNRTYSDTLPDRFKININNLRDHIYRGIPSSYKTGKYNRISYKFSDLQAYSLSSFISNGDVYSDWPELETYINEILYKVLPPELTKDSVIHAYIYKDGNVNAFMAPSGQFFINLGMLSVCNDEATIAGVMAHEIAHYHKRHSLKAYTMYELGKFSGGILNRNNKSNRFSVKQEQESDSLALEWILNSEYSSIGMYKVLNILKREEDRILNRLENKWELEETTHPLSEKRLSSFKASYKNNNGALFLVSETKFKEFKENIKSESLNFLLNDFQYYTCLESAFKFHLMDPDNSKYVYYLMESIRRICYTNTTVWQENFITNRYYVDYITSNNKRKKLKLDTPIFEKLDFNLLPISQEEAKYLKARFYWDGEQKFKTYEEAFEFYWKLAQALNCKECELTYALSFTKDEKSRNKYLDQYISNKNIKHLQFAKALKNNSVTKNLPQKKLLVFNEFDTYIKFGKERVPVRLAENDNNSIIHNIFDSITSYFPERQPIYMPDLKYFELDEYKLLRELEYFSFMYLRSKGEKTKLHILDPRYLKIYHKYKINEIEFINCEYFESANANNDIEKYKAAANTSYEDLFRRTKKTKSFGVYISSLREIDNRRMKYRYYGGNNILKFKDPGYQQVIWEIRNKLNDKEQEIYDADVRYQKGL